MRVLLVIFVGLVIFFAGCVKEKPKELQFKDDVVTVENYFVSNVAPYEKGEASIQFDIHNNGDRKIPYLEIDFFDIPGFEVAGWISCPIGEAEGKTKCKFTEKFTEFTEDNALEPLDVRSITIQLKSNEDISSPTPHTVSFAVRYVYFGFREASIPVIDGETRKQPLTKFRQSEPSTGPITLDIDPSIEREIIAGDKTIREHWGIGGNSPLPFPTKFKFGHVGSLKEKVKEVNISASSVRIIVGGLKTEGACDFCDRASLECQNKFGGPQSGFVRETITNNKYFADLGSKFYEGPDTRNYSTKSVLVPFDTLLCTFRPNLKQPEYSATISAFFAYKYEFIKKQVFVIQPLSESR